MPFILQKLKQFSGPVLTLGLFGISFALGLAIFSISGSVTISAICMALGSVSSALAARELVNHPADDHIKSLARAETRTMARQLSELSERITQIETISQQSIKERSTPERFRIDALSRDIERIGVILNDVIAILDAQDTRFTQISISNGKENAIHGTSINRAKHLAKPTNPLATIQKENILREDILNGKLKVQLADIAQIETGRIALRQVRCLLQGRITEFRTDRDLVSGEISPGIIQLFDRMRFGFAFEFAGQFGAQANSAPILCPLMGATFAHAEAADEIVAVIENNDKIARHLVLALEHERLINPTPPEDERLRRLQIAGTSLAAHLSEDLSVDPDILCERGVAYILADADLLLGRKQSAVKSVIHPHDLASFLARFNIALIAQNVDTIADAKALKSIGVQFASGSALAANGASSAALRPSVSAFPSGNGPSQSSVGTRAPVPKIHIETATAPLRERLRRVRI